MDDSGNAEEERGIAKDNSKVSVDINGQIIKVDKQLPANIEELHKDIIIGSVKLEAYRKALQAFDKTQRLDERLDNGFIQRRTELLEQVQQFGIMLIEAEQKFGAMLKEMFPPGGDRKSNLSNPSLKNYNITWEESTRAKALYDYPEQVNEAIDEAIEMGDIPTPFRAWLKIKTFRKKEERGVTETQGLPEGKWNVLYADPPWNYGDKLIEGYGAAEHHYNSMTIQELCDLNIRNIAADDAVLFLWVTSPILPECFSVINAWGFEYSASFIWDKIKHNWGHYNSVRHEFLLICTKGSFPKQNDELEDSVISIERSKEHSEKPEYFRKLIEKMYPNSKKIELFARRKTEGWQVWGAGINNDRIL
ncbi:hypothetical protein ES695_00015 [Candidatus Atribacteria bacterium 1244-E10-H5-B2]|nr:MAG: hypothetical protein ES695_00015 [Candidatus Atribacteria bacterium 1244-E10-H5-B2]